MKEHNEETFLEEINYHEIMLKTMLEYKNQQDLCIVTHKELSERLGKNITWISKAIKRLNAEDICVEMIDKGIYKVHYTNIKEQGVFPKILQLINDKITIQDFNEKGTLIREKYNVSKKTVQIFVGYLGYLCS